MIDETTKVFGYWNFPDTPYDLYAGELLVGKGEIELTWYGLDGSALGFDDLLPAIHGVDTKGNKMTLCDCIITSRAISHPGIPVITFSARYLLHGAQLQEAELFFDAASVCMARLNEWAEVYGFNTLNATDESTELQYTLPDPIPLFASNEIEYALLFHRQQPLFRHVHSFTIAQTTRLRISTRTPFSLSDFWSHFAPVRSFLTLAYFDEAKVEELRLKRGDRWLTIVFAWGTTSTKEAHGHHNFLFTYKDVQHELPSMFAKWLLLQEKIEPAVALLQESFGDRTILGEHKFLNIVQGLADLSPKAAEKRAASTRRTQAARRRDRRSRARSSPCVVKRAVELYQRAYASRTAGRVV